MEKRGGEEERLISRLSAWAANGFKCYQIHRMRLNFGPRASDTQILIAFFSSPQLPLSFIFYNRPFLCIILMGSLLSRYIIVLALNMESQGLKDEVACLHSRREWNLLYLQSAKDMNLTLRAPGPAAMSGKGHSMKL